MGTELMIGFVVFGCLLLLFLGFIVTGNGAALGMVFEAIIEFIPQLLSSV